MRSPLKITKIPYTAKAASVSNEVAKTYTNKPTSPAIGSACAGAKLSSKVVKKSMLKKGSKTKGCGCGCDTEKFQLGGSMSPAARTKPASTRPQALIQPSIGIPSTSMDTFNGYTKKNAAAATGVQANSGVGALTAIPPAVTYASEQKASLIPGTKDLAKRTVLGAVHKLVNSRKQSEASNSNQLKDLTMSMATSTADTNNI